MAAVWAEIARHQNSDAFSGLKTGATTPDIFIYQESNAYAGKEFFYKFNTITEVITEVSIAQRTQYGGTYRPTTAMTVHNGSLYGAAVVIYTWAPFRTAHLLQIFRIDKDSGALSILYDSWIPYNGPRIFYDDNGADNSAISTVKLVSFGGSLYAGINAFAPVVVGTSDYTNHTIAILKYSGGGWTSVYEVPNGTLYPDSHGTMKAFVSGDQQATYISTRIMGANEIVIAGTPFAVANDGSDFTPYPDAAWERKLWREDAGDIEYSGNYGAAWVLHHTYDDTPRLPYYPNHFDFQLEPIIVDKSGNTIKVYFDTVLDGSFVLDSDLGNFQGIVTYQGAYVILEADYSGVPCVWVYGRTPQTNAGAIPVGIDLDPFASQLIITGTTAHGSPFAKDIDVDNLIASGITASGISFSVSASGWLKPHAEFPNQVYLRGFAGPEAKIFVYSGYGFAASVLHGYYSSYVGGLDSQILNPDNIWFAITWSGVAPSGIFCKSITACREHDVVMGTPFPVTSLERIFLVVPGYLGSGDTAFVGASGTYYCPIKATIDLAEWEDRCDNLPAFTITDITGGD